MTQTLFRQEAPRESARPEYASWLQELRASARRAEQEELAELEWLATRRAG
jgi:hypothetical protein